jgi:Flp pilus assembly protein TadB
MRRVALIGFNAFAAAGCFVAGIFAAGVVPIPFVTVILGFVGLAYFLRRAERARSTADV